MIQGIIVTQNCLCATCLCRFISEKFTLSEDDFLQKAEHYVNQFKKSHLLPSVDHGSKLPGALSQGMCTAVMQHRLPFAQRPFLPSSVKAELRLGPAFHILSRAGYKGGVAFMVE